MKKSTIGAALFILAAAGTIALLVNSKLPEVNEKKLKGYADKVLTTCKPNPYKSDCYNDELPKLMDPPASLSMEDVFRVTRYVQSASPAYRYCYELGRSLSSKETRKDPGSWKSVIARCPATMCNNGCLHGALMEQYRDKTLSSEQIQAMLPELKTACEPHNQWNPVKVETAMCYYGLGGVLMSTTGGNPKTSSELCKALGRTHNDPYYTYSCIRAVFTAMYQDVKNTVGKTTPIDDYCSQYEGQENSACLDASWLLDPDQAKSPAGANTFCLQRRTSDDVARCYSSLLQVATVALGVNRDNLNDLNGYCLNLPNEYHGFCFGTVASRLLLVDPVYSADKARAMCVLADKAHVGSQCYSMLIDYAALNFHKNSAGAASFCDKLAPKLKVSCQKKLL